MLTVVVAEGIAIALLAVLVLGLLRSHGLILRALHELGAGLDLEADAGASGSGPVPVQLERGVVPASRPAGTEAADIVGSSLQGDALTVAVVGAGRRTLLAFLFQRVQRLSDLLGRVLGPGPGRAGRRPARGGDQGPRGGKRHPAATARR